MVHEGCSTASIFLSRNHQGLGQGNAVVVPRVVKDIEDIRSVIRQIKPLQTSTEQANRFGLPRKPNLQSRLLAFAYFLGVMLGDMSKLRGRTGRNMQVMLKLSKRHETNLRFGDFVVTCAGLLGIRMKRIKDCTRPPEDRSTFGGYVWSSQTSEFILWIFEKCLGLRPGETTTRNPIRARWLVNMPRDFQAWFLQGVADSDGYVDLNKHGVGIVVEPNQILIWDILEKLHVHFRKSKAKNQATVILGIKEAFGIPIFSPFARTHKFEFASRLVHAQRIQGPWPAWLRAEVNELTSRGEPSGRIVLTILERHDIAIRSQHIRKTVKNRPERKVGAEGGRLRNVFRVPFESAIGPTLFA